MKPVHTRIALSNKRWRMSDVLVCRAPMKARSAAYDLNMDVRLFWWQVIIDRLHPEPDPLPF